MSAWVKGPVKQGSRIRRIIELEEAGLRGQCVITGNGLRMPAAWVYQMQGHIINKYIKGGLWIYKGKRGIPERKKSGGK